MIQMSNIHGIKGSGPTPVIRPQPTSLAGKGQPMPSSPADADQVEISDAARYLSKVAALPDIRTEKVDEIRKALAENTYDIDGKLPQALDRLLEEHV